MAPARVTVDQLDRELDTAHAALAKVGGGLFELDAARERVAATEAGLVGASATRWVESGDQLAALWTWYQAVSEVLSSLAAEREASRLRPVDLDDMWGRLTGPSVQIPPDALDTGRRCLPDASAIGPEAPIALILQVVSAGYERAAETVTELEAVRDVVIPRLDQLDEQLHAVKVRAGSEGVRIPNEAPRIGDAIDALRRQLDVDPLSADVSTIPSLAAEVAGLNATVDKMAAAVGAAAEGLDELARQLDQAGEIVSALPARLAEVAEKVAGPPPDAGPAAERDEPVEIADLADELAALRSELDHATRVAATDRAAGERELRALTPKVSALTATATALSRTVEAPLAHRQELRGRLDAYRAKAHSIGRAEDFALDQLYRAAQDALYTAPCDLGVAEQRVTAYQSAVLEPPMEDRRT